MRSLQATAAIAVVVAVAAAILDVPLDALFHILLAPTNETLRMQHQERASKISGEVLSAIRRSSTAAVSVGGLQLLRRHRRLSLLSTSKATIIEAEALKLRRELLLKTSSVDSFSTRDVAAISQQRRTQVAPSPSSPTQQSFGNLWEELQVYAQSLALGPIRNGFFHMWGLPSEEPSVRALEPWLAVTKEEERRVREEAQILASRLERATDAHVGIVILHTFVIDLLGGLQTAAGRIFASKTHADFLESRVVSLPTKMVVVFLLLVLNLFFVGFTVLRSYQRGLGWQQQYLFACLLQVIAEVFFFETVVVLWAHVLVPQLAFNDVSQAYIKVKEILDDLADRLDEDSVPRAERYSLFRSKEFNSPSFFSVAYRLAFHYPSLMESRIVLSYRTTFPPACLEPLMMQYKQTHRAKSARTNLVAIAPDSETESETHWMRNCFTLFTAMWMAAVIYPLSQVPMHLQMFVLNVLQPVIFAAICYLIYLCIQHPLLFLATAAIVLSVGYLIYWLINRYSSLQKETLERQLRKSTIRKGRVEYSSALRESSVASSPRKSTRTVAVAPIINTSDEVEPFTPVGP